MAGNPFANQSVGLIGPFAYGADVTPDDANDLAGGVARSLWIGVAGTLKFDDASGATHTTTVPQGVFPFGVKRVWATGTSATGIVAGY